MVNDWFLSMNLVSAYPGCCGIRAVIKVCLLIFFYYLRIDGPLQLALAWYLGMCGMDFSSSVSVQFWKTICSVWFSLQISCKIQKRAVCGRILLLLQRGWRAQLLSQYCTVLTVLTAWCWLIIWFHDHLLSDSVRNVKNVIALSEWLKYWLNVWDKFGFEKSHGNWNFGFHLLALVRFGFLKTEPKFGFRTSLMVPSLYWARLVAKISRVLSFCHCNCSDGEDLRMVRLSVDDWLAFVAGKSYYSLRTV